MVGLNFSLWIKEISVADDKKLMLALSIASVITSGQKIYAALILKFYQNFALKALTIGDILHDLTFLVIKLAKPPSTFS